MIMNLAIAALLLPAAATSAAPHRLDVRVANGRSVFTQALRVEDGQQSHFTGRVAGTGGAVRSVIVSVVLGINPSSLEYQLQLSAGQGSSLPFLEAQGSVLVRPGAGVQVLDCGAWTLEFALDASPRKPAKPAAAWDDGGLGNARVSMELTNGRKPLVCRFVTRNGAQTNIVDSALIGGLKTGLIYNSRLTAQDGAFKLEYQLEDSRVGASHLQLQNQETLTPGRKAAVPGQGYQLGFLVEGVAPAAAAPAASAPSQVAPLLR